WNRQFLGKDVYCTQRQYTKASVIGAVRLVTDAVEHLVQRAIAAGSHDDLKTFAYSLGGQPARIARRAREFQGALSGDGFELFAKTARFLASSGWIENDTGAHNSIVSASRWSESRRKMAFAANGAAIRLVGYLMPTSL